MSGFFDNFVWAMVLVTCGLILLIIFFIYNMIKRQRKAKYTELLERLSYICNYSRTCLHLISLGVICSYPNKRIRFEREINSYPHPPVTTPSAMGDGIEHMEWCIIVKVDFLEEKLYFYEKDNEEVLLKRITSEISDVLNSINPCDLEKPEVKTLTEQLEPILKVAKNFLEKIEK